MRQNVLERDDKKQPCRPDLYEGGGIINNEKYSTPCFEPKAHHDIRSKTNDIRKVVFSGRLGNILKYETCTSYPFGGECEHFIGTVTDIPGK